MSSPRTGWLQHWTPGTGSAAETRIMTNPEPARGWVESAPAGRAPPLTEAQDRRRRQWNRARAVQMACAVVSVVCGLFAVVLAAHVIMVVGGANPANGVATFVRGFADGVSLGFEDLFTPVDAKLRTLLNDGLAALVWLGFGAVASSLIRRFALPGPRALR
jgi:hypothetical protein